MLHLENLRRNVYKLGQAVHEIWIIYWIYPFTWTLSSIVYVISLRKLHIFSRGRAAAAA